MDITEKPAWKPELSHISLCFGYGGIDLGLDRVFGRLLRLAAVCEIESFSLENALAKMEGGLLPAAPIWTDLRTFPWEEFQGVSLVSGGFPCQPFSAAGRRAADADGRHLFPAILDGIKRCGPSLVFLENVEGIVSAKLAGDGWNDPPGTPVLLHVLRELERVGYRATAGIFSASEVGAPHQRKRIFILAHRDEPGWETRWDNALARNRGGGAHWSAAYCGDQGGEKLADSCSAGLQRRERCGQAGAQGEPPGHAAQCSGELADREKHGLQLPLNAESQGGPERGQGVSTSGGGGQGGELANAAGGRLKQCEPEGQPQGDARVPGQQELELADPGSLHHGDLGGEGSSLLDGATPSENSSVGAFGIVGVGETCSSAWFWPSRPGFAQFWWEPPRVVDSENGGWPANHTPPGAERWGAAEPCVADGEAMGNSALGGDDGGKPRGMEEAAGEGRCGDDAFGNTSQSGLEDAPSAGSGCESGNPLHQGWPTCAAGGAGIPKNPDRGDGAAIADNQSTGGDGRENSEIAALASLGRDIDGAPAGVGVSELPRLRHEELVEIHQWMVLNTNRNDELRLLGNGVVAQTCEVAFRTLFNELLTSNNNPIT